MARQNNVSLPDLLRANPQIRDPDKVNVGQQVRIPQAAQAAQTAATTSGAPADGPAELPGRRQAPPPATERPLGGPAPQVRSDPATRAQLDTAMQRANVGRAAGHGAAREQLAST